VRTLPRAVIVALAVAAASSAPACRRSAPDVPARAPQSAGAPVRGAARAQPPDRRTGCADQAARVAAHPGWRTPLVGRPPNHARRFTDHYSEKYDECYVLIERAVPVEHGADAVVSELWEAFDAAVVAEFTSDPRADVRRSVCQVSVSDQPFTSCRVAQYFIDQHMQH
jgi:hypothetical protein